MKIDSIHLIGFGKFANRIIEFKDNFHVLMGENEAGKTTLINAILAVLYGFKGRSDNVRHLKMRYRPWDSSLPYQVGLTLTDNFDDKYFIKRNLEDEMVEVLLWEKNNFIPAGKRLEQILEESLGLKNMRIFESTLLIRQEEISNLDHNQLNDAITQKITEGGNEVIIKNVFKVLDDKQKELTRGIERQSNNPGILKALSDQIRQFEEELVHLEKYETDYASLSKEFKDKTNLCDKINDRLTLILPQIAIYETNAELTAKRENIATEQNELQSNITRTQEKQALVKENTDKINVYKPIENFLNEMTLQMLENYIAKVNSLEESIDNYNKKIEITEHQIQQIQFEQENLTNNLVFYYKVKYSQDNLIEAQRINNLIKQYHETIGIKESEISKYSQSDNKESKRPKLVFGLSVTILSLFGLVFRNLIGYTIFGLLFTIGLILIILSRKNTDQQYKQLIEHLEAEIERLKVNITNNERILNGLLGDEDIETFKTNVVEVAHLEKDITYLDDKMKALDTTPLREEVSKLEQQIMDYQDKIDELLAKGQSIDINDYRDKLTKLNHHKREHTVNSEAINIILNGRKIEELQSKLALLSIELLNINNEIKSLEINLSSEEYLNMLGEKEDLSIRQEVLTKDLIQLETALKHFEINLLNGQDIWALRNNLAERQNEYEKYQIQNKSIELAINVMHESVEEAQMRMAPYVQEEVVRIFKSITSKRYDQVSIDIVDGNLNLRVFSPDKEDYIATSQLSTGTRDQFYLALRIALGKYLSENKNFPLFLDDPFINFDDNRIGATIEVLKDMAKELQIIWLTKDVNLHKHLSGVKTETLN